MDRKIEKKKWPRKQHFWLLAGAVFLLFMLYSLFFSDKSARLNIDVQRLSIDSVRYGVFQDFIAVSGTVEPIRTIFLDAVEGGRVEEILHMEGSILKKGDPVILLSNDHLSLEISNTEAQITRAINDSRNAQLSMQQQLLNKSIRIVELRKKSLQDKRNYENNRILYSEQYLSSEDYLRSKEEYEATLGLLSLYFESHRIDSIYHASNIITLEESIERMRRNLMMTMKRLDNLTISAPVNGELTSLRTEVGQVITRGTRIGTINVLDSYKLRVEIDEHYIARVFRGLEGDCDFSGQVFKAKINTIYPEVRGGRFAVDMVFTGEVPQQIRIGQTTRIRLQLGESSQALLIPRGGFYQSTGGQWIFVVDPSGETAFKRNITIGRQNPFFYEVLDGLHEGERVIVSGYDFGVADKLILK